MKSKHLLISLTLLILVLMMTSCNKQGNGASEEPSTSPAPPPPPSTEITSPSTEITSPSPPSPPPSPPPPRPVNASENSDVIVDLDLKLLLKDFYAPNLGQKSGYGYYIYLVFADNSSTTRAKRLKASEAFVCSFSSATGEDVQQLPKETIALFLAPLVSRQNVEQMRQSRDPYGLMKNYSYSEGQLFQNKIAGSKAFESIAVLGSRTMLDPRIGEPFPEQVEVLDLSQFSPHEIKETIVGLRKVVLSRNTLEGALPQFESLQQPRFELRLASFFESVGQGVISLAAISSAIADERECL